MKKLLLAVAALCAMSFLPAFAEHEWSVNGNVIENDLWTLNASWNGGNGTLGLSGATPKVDGLTTLDISNMILGGKQMSTLTCWAASKISTVKKLVIPYTMSSFTVSNGGISNLEEICTPDGGHTFSISTWNGGNGNGIASGSKISGAYVVNGIGSGTMPNNAFAECASLQSLEMNGSFSAIGERSAYACYALESLAFNTTGTITAIPDNLCGYWGNQGSSPSPLKLTSLTLNGKPLLRNANIIKVGNNPGSGYGAMAHCSAYVDIIDLPNCTTIGNFSFRDTGVPFANLMSVTGIGAGIFGQCASLERVVFGSESQPSLSYDDKGGLFQSAFGSAVSPVVIWNAKTAPASLPKNGFWASSDYKFTNYVRKEATGWASLTSGIKQNFVSMDTAFKVNLRLDNEVVMTTLMPGVSGQNPSWTIPAGWFLEPGKTFGVGTVKDTDGNVIDGASATPDGTGLNLTITLPATLVKSVDGTTQDDEVFVDMVAQDNKDPQISVTVVDADNGTIVEDSFEATVGTSVTKDYSAAVFGNDEYYFNNVLSLVVDPADAATATFGLDAKLTLENIAKDAEIIVKIDRAARPTQLAYWNVDVGNYTMSDGVWTFRCDFTGDKAVIADAIGYKGADRDVAEVDFAKPIGTDGSSAYQVTTLDWGATINGSAIDTTKTADHCGKDIVINGGAGTARTLVGVLNFPTTVKTISGWGYCGNLTVDPASLATVSNFGKYALAYTSVGGALSFAEDNVVTIGNSAFEKSIKITSLNVPALNSTIGEKAFWHCTGLKTVELRGVTSIGWAAFSRDDQDKGATPGTYSMEKVVLSPALTLLNGSAFYKSTKSGCVFDAVSPKDMPEAKSGDGKISGNDFQDLGAGSIVIPFKGTCTIGAKTFHWSTTTNFIFWGKAPTAWIGNSTTVYDAMKEFNTSVKTDRRFTVSLAMDRAGWEGVATTLKKNCDAGEWTALNPPEKAFGYVMANTTRIWLCEGKSPWERGLIICFRGEDQD